MTKQQKGAEANQTGLCLSDCLSAYLYVRSTCLRASDRPISRSSLAPTVVAGHDFISPSASVQPDLPDVPGLFQSMTGWLAG